jgi:hypothetical protein
VWQIVRRLWTFLSEQLEASPAAGVQEPAAGDRQLILGVLKAGLEKTRVKKNQPSVFFWFFWGFLWFFELFYISAQLMIECRFYFFLKYS